MRIFVMVALLLMTGCTSINANGDACSKAETSDCGNYVPLYSPMKLFIKSAAHSIVGDM